MTEDATYFRLEHGRGRDALAELLPDTYEGIVHSERMFKLWHAFQRCQTDRDLLGRHRRRDAAGIHADAALTNPKVRPIG